MTIVGWHASHEQVAPSELLRMVQRAETAGFGAAMSSDHFSPWSRRQGEFGAEYVPSLRCIRRAGVRG
jgi:alkanesulfonate monooxygenase SsuD/methylene tetrahydromethanopterin reductase-like flavin-dependent oxidoreductase (luciferase family)